LSWGWFPSYGDEHRPETQANNITVSPKQQQYNKGIFFLPESFLLFLHHFPPSATPVSMIRGTNPSTSIERWEKYLTHTRHACCRRQISHLIENRE
jgi:hypothetical protein